MKVYNNRKSKNKWLANRFKRYFQDSKSVLDVGCSDSGLKNYVKGKKYLGIDKFGKPDLKIDLDKISRLPFKDHEFDFVVCSDILEHLENLHLIFDEICRISNKYVLITLPNPVLDIIKILLKIKNKTKDPESKTKYSKYYGLPRIKPKDRHRWIYTYDELKDFIYYNSSKNKFNVKIFEIERINKKGLRRLLFKNNLANSFIILLKKK